MWTNVYRNGTFLRTIEGVKHWSNNHQRPTLFAPFTLLPGDRLTLSAEFNVDKVVASGRPAPAWGYGTADEMLITTLFVYPRPRRVGPAAAPGDTIASCGGLHRARLGGDVTVCAGRVEAADNPAANTLGVDLFPVSARAVADEAGWADPFNEPTSCARGRGARGGRRLLPGVPV